MTESEWVTGHNPESMAYYLREWAGVRKLRLAAVAVARRVEHLAGEPAALEALAVAERFADGAATEDEVYDAWDAFGNAVRGGPSWPAVPDTPRLAALHALGGGVGASGVESWAWSDRPREAAGGGLSVAVNRAASALVLAASPGVGDRRSVDPSAEWGARKEPYKLFSALLRDIFTPFYSATVPPACLGWNESIIPKLAQAIYDDRAFDRLPILADALEEAGCTDA